MQYKISLDCLKILKKKQGVLDHLGFYVKQVGKFDLNA